MEHQQALIALACYESPRAVATSKRLQLLGLGDTLLGTEADHLASRRLGVYRGAGKRRGDDGHAERLELDRLGVLLRRHVQDPLRLLIGERRRQRRGTTWLRDSLHHVGTSPQLAKKAIRAYLLRNSKFLCEHCDP